MRMVRVLMIAGLAATLGGCNSFMPLKQANTSWDNVWRPDMKASQVVRAPSLAVQANRLSSANDAQVYATATRGYVDMPQQTVSMARSVDVPHVAMTGRTSMPLRGSVQTVNRVAGNAKCETQRAAFGSGMQVQLDEFIRLQMSQAEALADADIDVATKARLMLELSNSAQRLMHKSKGLEFFRAGLYGLCQAHLIGAMNEATYSAKFEKLMQAASDSIRFEESNAALSFAVSDVSVRQVSMPRR